MTNKFGSLTNQTMKMLEEQGIRTNRGFIGFEDMFDRLTASVNVGTYPPYNLIKESKDEYTIEMAIAGFSKDNVDVTVENGQLTIEGTKAEVDTERDFITRNVAARSFTTTFPLAEHIVVKGASIEDGILTINLLHEVPEEKKPKVISIK